MPKGYPGTSAECSIDGCYAKSRAHGLCKIHNGRRHDVYRKDERRNRLYQLKYKITLEEYNQMFVEQNGCCKICSKHQSECKYKLSVDHDHKCCPISEISCGKCIRGLLCNLCNTTVGRFERNPEILNKTVEYIKENNYGKSIKLCQ